MPASSSPTAETAYSERLYLPFGWWIGALGMMLLLELQVWMYLPVHPLVTLLVPLAVVACLLLLPSLSKVEIVDGVLRLGKFSLPCTQISSVEELDERNLRQAAGAAGDPAAVTMVRPWIRSATKVVCLTDDPPYVLISTRHPEKFSAAVVACATAAAE